MSCAFGNFCGEVALRVDAVCFKGFGRFYVLGKQLAFNLSLFPSEIDKCFCIALRTVNSGPTVGCYTSLLVGIDDKFDITLGFFDQLVQVVIV